MKWFTSGRVALLALVAYALVCWAAWKPVPPIGPPPPLTDGEAKPWSDDRQVFQLAWQMSGHEAQENFLRGIGLVIAAETIPGFWLAVVTSGGC
jgi:hypothetical protein